MAIRLSKLAGLALALAAQVVAAQAPAVSVTTAQRLNVRAGPARDYPVVTVAPAAYAVSLHGCVEGYRWCDIEAGGQRGWAYAGNLRCFHRGRHVLLAECGPALGIPIVDFVLEDYWGEHYRDRPWYGERARWGDRDGPPPPPRVRRPWGAYR